MLAISICAKIASFYETSVNLSYAANLKTAIQWREKECRLQISLFGTDSNQVLNTNKKIANLLLHIDCR